MTIEEFDKIFWNNDFITLKERMYVYYHKKGDSKHLYGKRGYYDSDSIEKTVSETNTLSADEIEKKIR